MKQQQKFSKRNLKKMPLEKSYPDMGKRITKKTKNQGRQRSDDDSREDYNAFDNFYDFD
ncbi:MAG: hypothetical protein ACI9XO_003699 [Paraglaciecola sp.]|jgi:hypothetical protein